MRPALGVGAPLPDPIRPIHRRSAALAGRRRRLSAGRDVAQAPARRDSANRSVVCLLPAACPAWDMGGTQDRH
jgi:hypothetical protein